MHKWLMFQKVKSMSRRGKLRMDTSGRRERENNRGEIVQGREKKEDKGEEKGCNFS